MKHTVEKIIIFAVYSLIVSGGLRFLFVMPQEGEDQREIDKLRVQMESAEADRRWEQETKKHMHIEREKRDAAFVKCVNAVGVEPCTILSNWVDPEARVYALPFFGEQK